MADHGDKRAERTLALAERYDELLSTILVGNNVVNIALSSIATLVDTLKSAGIRVILFTPPPFCFGQETYENWKKLQEAYPDFAREHGAELFDFEASLDAEPPFGNVCQYGAHPNTEGGTAAANAFLACNFFE